MDDERIHSRELSGSTVSGRIGPYRIKRLLGEGGMGQVYLAEGPDGGQVALKVLAAALADSALAEHLKREGKLLESIDHPHVVRVLDHGADRDTTLVHPGGLLICDAGSRRLRQVDPVTGLVTTVVGTGESGFNGDAIPLENVRLAPELIDTDSRGRLYVLDGTGRVRRFLLGEP